MLTLLYLILGFVIGMCILKLCIKAMGVLGVVLFPVIFVALITLVYILI
jgi:hypothetical protein